jgi:hypothetical protein
MVGPIGRLGVSAKTSTWEPGVKSVPLTMSLLPAGPEEELRLIEGD